MPGVPALKGRAKFTRRYAATKLLLIYDQKISRGNSWRYRRGRTALYSTLAEPSAVRSNRAGGLRSIAGKKLSGSVHLAAAGRHAQRSQIDYRATPGAAARLRFCLFQSAV